MCTVRKSIPREKVMDVFWPVNLLPSSAQFKYPSHLNELRSFTSAKTTNDNNLSKFKVICFLTGKSFY